MLCANGAYKKYLPLLGVCLLLIFYSIDSEATGGRGKIRVRPPGVEPELNDYIWPLVGVAAVVFFGVLTAIYDAIKSNSRKMAWITIIGMLVIMGVIIDMYASIYTVTGLKMTSPTESLDAMSSLYFSIVTWTTLGYGDITPATVASRNIAASEAMIGYLYMALFVSLIFRALTMQEKR